MPLQSFVQRLASALRYDVTSVRVRCSDIFSILQAASTQIIFLDTVFQMRNLSPHVE